MLVERKIKTFINRFLSFICLILATLFSSNIVFAQKSTQDIYDVYYFVGNKNFGDRLNEDLLKYFNIKYKFTGRQNAKNIFIGSILDCGLKQDNVNVFGAGFIHKPDKDFKLPEKLNLHCVRGKLTKKYISMITGKKLDNCLLGDPGLLCSRIFPQNENKIYDVGIICHYCDKKSPYLKNIKLMNKTYTFIDIQAPTQEVCKKINQCKFILSSAMHGLIASDSYGIPNQRIILTDNNWGHGSHFNFKFNDYYSIYENVSVPEAIDLKYCTISDDDIDKYRNNYNIPQNVISKYCDEYTTLIKNYFNKNHLH